MIYVIAVVLFFCIFSSIMTATKMAGFVAGRLPRFENENGFVTGMFWAIFFLLWNLQ
jgi:hypothetical protein